MCGRLYRLRCISRVVLLSGSAVLALTGIGEVALAQVSLPEVVVSGAKPKTKPQPVRRRVAAPTTASPTAVAPVNAADVKNNEFDNARNDHANVQFRINGVMLPDGVTGFGSVLDTSLIGSMSLITGALPAEFGMRTVGLI